MADNGTNGTGEQKTPEKWDPKLGEKEIKHGTKLPFLFLEVSYWFQGGYIIDSVKEREIRVQNQQFVGSSLWFSRVY